MTHAYTKQELSSIADDMTDDEVMLCDMWDREHFNAAHEVELESLQDEVDTFIQRQAMPL
jgi:hypothetical protein